MASSEKTAFFSTAFILFTESLRFELKDFFGALFFTLKKNAVEIVPELGYFTLRTKNLLKKRIVFQGMETSEKIIAGFVTR